MTSVLYVEDDARSRMIMKMLLTSRMKLDGVEIWEDSADFEQRLQALDPKPDVIFLDIHVDPHSGFDMLKMVRAHEQFEKTPTVALTASVMNEEIEQLRHAGFHGCIAKPIDIDTFPDIFERILKGESIWTITD